MPSTLPTAVFLIGRLGPALDRRSRIVFRGERRALGTNEDALDFVEASFRVLVLLDAVDPTLDEPTRLQLGQVASPLPSASVTDLRAVEAALAGFACDIEGSASSVTRALERAAQRLSHRARWFYEDGP